jgi:hypothetical protein
MPIVEFSHKPWAQPNPDRVILSRPVWAHYGHTDLEKVRVATVQNDMIILQY